MTQQPGHPIYKTVVVLWLTLSVASVVLAAITWRQLSNTLAAAREAVAIREEVDSILKILLDAETSQRGFTLTGNETFLEPMEASGTNMIGSFERLTDLVHNDPEMLRRVVELRAQAELSLNYQRSVVAVVRTKGGLKRGAEIVANGEGKQMMDDLRVQATQIRRMRSDLFLDDSATTRSQLLRASLTSLVAGIVGIGAGLIAFWLSRVMLRHRENERELMQAKLQAERSSEEKTVFLANMSHEIRTPMNAILGFSELLEHDLKDPRHRQYLQSIRTSAGSLLQLINDILDMSKVEAGVMELHPEPTDAREICEFLHAVFSEPAARKGIKLECRVEEGLPTAMLLDRLRLRQILVNLVGNAVKFTDHGNIYVRVIGEKQPGSSHINLLIEVQDTGVGIPADRLEAIFKPFVQAGTHQDKERQGTGLGLAIVKRLTEMMGGTVTAASVPGQGSAFSLRFPQVSVSARLPVPASGEAEQPADFNELRPARLLVVDDNETNCELVGGMFAGTHHQLFFSRNGEDAIVQAISGRPDLILMDLRMPVMDGWAALAKIRKIAGLELTPVIAVTASSLLTQEKELKEQFSGYIRKPFSQRELFDELVQFLRPETKPDPLAKEETAARPPEPVRPELLAELRRLQAGPWPALRDSLAINESKAFAKTLETLAQRWDSPVLLGYARTLARHAENYAVVELERQLQDFGAFVERLQKTS